ncbi:hypothetical protein [Streptococcus moroccensis]|uniref:V/A-type H+-transporting ATPase subunit G/H n=1 Tax=Streptococcus moroccensis TaxID=1451356 RepID=A0ABT9YUM7_9STRE|nr:hypothetical protein [Streptococcus moroccensis]MDQ0223296.1 V/A-type H+-transporting ATPase subunit G/H [Streptococcus moroccensis]
MANATLQMMQEIEAEAQAVLDTYEQEIARLKDAADQQLAVIGQEYDHETKQQIDALQSSADEEIQKLRQEIQATIAQNETAVREALTDKKDDLVQAIVDKVVANYGH